MPDVKIKIIADDTEARAKIQNFFTTQRNESAKATKDQLDAAYKVSQATLNESKAVTEAARQTKLLADAKVAETRAGQIAVRTQAELTRARLDENRVINEQIRIQSAQTRALAEQMRAETALERATRQRIAAGTGNSSNFALPRTFAGFTPAGAIQAGIAAVAANGVQMAADIGKQIIETRADYESLEKGLNSVTGSAAKTQQQIERLREVAKLPGLGFEEAVKGATRLQAAGISAEEAEKALRGFGKAIAQVGGGREELDGVILALSQIASKSKVSAEEIRQLAERVPQIRKIMQEAFGTADTEVIQKAGIEPKTFLHVLIDAADKTKEVSGGMKNDLQNIKDAFKDLFNEIGRTGQPVVSAVINPLANFVALGAKGLRTSTNAQENSDAILRISGGRPMGTVSDPNSFRQTLDATIARLERDLGPISGIPTSDPRITPGVAAQREQLERLRAARNGLAFQQQYDAAGGISYGGKPQIDAVALANASKNVEAIIHRIPQAKTRSALESLRRAALDEIAAAPPAEQQSLHDKLASAYERRLDTLKREDAALARAQIRQAATSANTYTRDLLRNFPGMFGITDEGVAAYKENQAADKRTQQGNAEFYRIRNAWNAASMEGAKEVAQQAEDDAKYAAELAEEKNEQRLQELRRSYDYVIRFLEDEQRTLNDVVREAIDRGDVPKARNALRSLVDNQTRMAGFQYNSELTSVDLTNPFDIIQNRMLAAPQIFQRIQESQRELSPLEEQINNLERSQRIAGELQQDEYRNRDRIKLGAFAGQIGRQTAEQVGYAIAQGIETGNAKSALKNLGTNLASSFVDAMTREAITRPLTNLFTHLGKQIADGGHVAGAEIYKAVGALYGLFEAAGRKKKPSILGAIAGIATGILTGNPLAGIAVYNVGQGLETGDLGQIAVGVGGYVSSGAPTPTFGTIDYGQVNGRAVNITTNIGTVNDKADADRISANLVHTIYKAIGTDKFS